MNRIDKILKAVRAGLTDQAESLKLDYGFQLGNKYHLTLQSGKKYVIEVLQK